MPLISGPGDVFDSESIAPLPSASQNGETPQATAMVVT